MWFIYFFWFIYFSTIFSFLLLLVVETKLTTQNNDTWSWKAEVPGTGPTCFGNGNVNVLALLLFRKPHRRSRKYRMLHVLLHERCIIHVYYDILWFFFYSLLYSFIVDFHVWNHISSSQKTCLCFTKEYFVVWLDENEHFNQVPAFLREDITSYNAAIGACGQSMEAWETCPPNVTNRKGWNFTL